MTVPSHPSLTPSAFSLKPLVHSLCFLLITFCLLTPALFAAPYPPNGRPIEWTQPNGTVLELRVFGDEFYGRTETLDGHTVVFDTNENVYYYAKLSADGTAFEASDQMVAQDAPTPASKNLRLPADEVQRIAASNRARMIPDADERWQQKVQAARVRGEGIDPSGPQPSSIDPTTGEFEGLTILVQFPDDPETTSNDPINFPTDRDKVERFCNESGYTDDGNTGSVKDYFLDQSEEQLTYTQRVAGPITLPEPRNFYNFANYPTNSVFRDAGDTGRMLVRDAIAILQDQDFDFTGLSTNDFNQVLATNIFFAGADSGVFSQGLWPHRFSVSSIEVGTSGNSIRISDYQITNAETAAIVPGTFIHESGHLLLGYPDLYDVSGGSEGIGEHGIMGSGNYLNDGRTAAPINAYFKEVSGWTEVLDLDGDRYFNLDLATTGNEAVRIRKPGSETEYFLIENRGDGDPWAEFSPDKGIIIWHIDETKFGNEAEQMTAQNHFEVSVEQADGLFDLENNRNRGDSSDYFDATTQIFGELTTPSSKWWDGTASGLELTVQSLPGSTMTIVNGQLLPNSLLVISPNGGEAIDETGSFLIRWDSTIDDDSIRIELYKGGNFLSVISEEEDNDGEFEWIPSEEFDSARDYQIRISGIDDPSVVDLSDRNFTLASEFFPFDGEFPEGWTSGSGDVPWVVSDEEATAGTASLRSGLIGSTQTNRTSELVVTRKTIAGEMSFDLKYNVGNVGSPVEFYLNGVRQFQLEGESDWQNYQYDIPSGDNTFRWVYRKVSSIAPTNAGAFLDQVVFPERPSPGTVIVFSPNNGEEFAPGGSEEITWVASIESPVKIELLRDGAVDSIIVESTDNDDSFQWDVPSDLEPGTNYRIRISSTENSEFTDTSDNDFSIVGEVFPPNGEIPPGWIQSPGSNRSWVPTSDRSNDGGFSLESADINRNQSAAIEVSDEFLVGTVSFAYLISTSSGAPFEFFIDDERVLIDESNSIVPGNLEGQWQTAQFELSAGEHTLKWQYSKGNNFYAGQEKVWLDSVVLPEPFRIGPILTFSHETEGEIAAESEFTFPSRIVNTSNSAIETFTLENSGDEPLAEDTEIVITSILPGEFEVVTPPELPLENGGSTTFQVAFTPFLAGSRTATLSIGGNLVEPFEFTLLGTGSTLDNLPDWLAFWELEGNAQELTADDDGDGVSLLEEYAYNLNPTMKDRKILTPGNGNTGNRTISGLPNIQLVSTSEDESILMASYPQHKNDPALVYTVEFGSSLEGDTPESFAPAAGTLEIVPGTVAHDRIRQFDSETTSTSGKRFGRVRVEYVPEQEGAE
jgi:M6 family metalloprotease-like protein